MTIVALIAAVTLLIFINSFYVAAQFSSVVARKPRLAQLAEENNPRAVFMLDVVENPQRLDIYVATCQVGITVSSLALGFYGQARAMVILEPVLSMLGPGSRVLATSIAAFIVLIVFTILQVIFGELLPKNIGLLHPEKLALMTAPGMRFSLRLLAPLIWLLNGSGLLVLKLLGSDMSTEQMNAHTPAEIEILVEESSAGGVLDDVERRLLVNTLRLRNANAQKAMIPRNNMLAAPVDSDLRTLLSLLADSPYSRLPLYADSMDSIVGIVHLKDIICAVRENTRQDGDVQQTVADCLHPALFVPELADIGEVMARMQREHHNLAIVVDEYGGTAGMITLEDLIEEIVGEFNDEFDIQDQPIELLEDNVLRVGGDVALDDLELLLDIDLRDYDLDTRNIETVGGMVLSLTGRIPESGDVVHLDDIPIRIDSVIDNRIHSVSIPVKEEVATEIFHRMEDL